jgi:hypothetical protein
MVPGGFEVMSSRESLVEQSFTTKSGPEKNK